MKLHQVVIELCDDCLTGVHEECHAPGCAAVPGLSELQYEHLANDSQVVAVRDLVDAVNDYMLASSLCRPEEELATLRGGMLSARDALTDEFAGLLPVKKGAADGQAAG